MLARKKIEKYLDVLSAKKTGYFLAFLIIAAFGVLSLIRLYPFENSLQDVLNSKDDWGRYASFALDIKHNGLSMPSLKENYWAPAGFLYNYFVALCFYLFGENTVPVFIIQNLLLGLSVTLIYLTFRNKMTRLTGLLFLFTLLLFALVDVSKYYSFRLLSENLALFTVAVFFFCFIKGMEKNKFSLQLLASVFLGLSVLIRPNIFPFEIILIAIALIYYRREGIFKPVLFLLLLIISSSLLALRNYFAVGSIVFLPTEGIEFGEHFFNLHNSFAGHYLQNFFFIFGYLSPLNQEFKWRPHWTIMWLGYFIYLFFRIRESRRFEIWEMTSHLFILCYFTLLIFIAPELSSYGFRLLIPAIFIVLPFSFMGIEKLAKSITTIPLFKTSTTAS